MDLKEYITLLENIRADLIAQKSMNLLGSTKLAIPKLNNCTADQQEILSRLNLFNSRLTQVDDDCEACKDMARTDIDLMIGLINDYMRGNLSGLKAVALVTYINKTGEGSVSLMYIVESSKVKCLSPISDLSQQIESMLDSRGEVSSLDAIVFPGAVGGCKLQEVKMYKLFSEEVQLEN